MKKSVIKVFSALVVILFSLPAVSDENMFCRIYMVGRESNTYTHTALKEISFNHNQSVEKLFSRDSIDGPYGRTTEQKKEGHFKISIKDHGDDDISLTLSEIKKPNQRGKITKYWVDLIKINIDFDEDGRFLKKYERTSASHDIREFMYKIFVSCKDATEENPNVQSLETSH
ncbi:MAG: hypothetical protein KDD52_09425 [Bdellovibrionales bacterium]|nr:hypothetical protein [Bdellovibrionales bacterium]